MTLELAHYPVEGIPDHLFIQPSAPPEEISLYPSSLDTASTNLRISNVTKEFADKLHLTLQSNYPVNQTIFTKHGRVKLMAVRGTRNVCIIGTVAGIALTGYGAVVLATTAAGWGKLVGAIVVVAGGYYTVATGLTAYGVHRMSKTERVRMFMRIDKRHKARQMPKHLFKRLGITKNRKSSRKIVKAMIHANLLTEKDRQIIHNVSAETLSSGFRSIEREFQLDKVKMRQIFETYRAIASEPYIQPLRDRGSAIGACLPAAAGITCCCLPIIFG